jgi:hypothetical protein
LFIGIPQLFYPLSVLRINAPDFGYTVLVSATLALGYGIVWAVLCLRLASMGKPGVVNTDIPQPAKA